MIRTTALTGPTSDLASQLPLAEPLHPAPDPLDVFTKFARLPHCLFLDSALRRKDLGRYSFVVADPVEFYRRGVDDVSPFNELASRLERQSSSTMPGLPPFQGGAAGLFSYDLGSSLERLPRPRYDEFATPALAVGFYDVVAAFDHVENRAWLISQGFPEQDPQRRSERAADRLRQFKTWLLDSEPPEPTTAIDAPLAVDELAPQFEVAGYPGLTSTFTSDGYRNAVRRAIDYIYAGDIFQVNFAQRLLHPAVGSSIDLYQRLRARNPATFSAFFDLGDYQIVSASPERFLSCREGIVEARPIKGTRQRSQHPEADLFAGDDLLRSEKDRAENTMIVDLLRNDLSRVCQPDSVRVTDLCRLEVYQYVQHLVSVVQGRLRDECKPLDLIQASFPGGSITGAPKVRAMEIIAELEPTARGAYCGSIGYIGFDGSMDLNILIRTITAGRGWWQMGVGGGIVAQSDPQSELEESWHKAVGLLKALR